MTTTTPWRAPQGAALALALLCAPAPAVDAEEGDLAPSVEALLAAHLDDVPQGGDEPPGPDALWDQAIREHGTIEPLLDELKGIATSDTASEERRRDARRLQVALTRRRGDLRQALTLLERLIEGYGVEELPTAEGAEEEGEEDAATERSLAPIQDRLDLASLYDATGQRAEGLAAYESLLPEVAGTELETHVRVRVALLAMEQDDERQDDLAEYAGRRDADAGVRNRSAIVLGLLGRPAEAIELFVVEGEGTERFEQEIRVAAWALEAELPEKAQGYAWQAWESATMRRDRHYALALLVESHRADDSLDRLIDAFATEEDLGSEARDVWIDLLRETGRIDEAVQLFSDAAGGAFTVEQRRELLEMYREAGREDVMVEAYRELVRDEPHELSWREGLSRFLLERGDRLGAITVWDGYLEADGYGHLVWGAEALQGLGLDELAIECADRAVDLDQETYAALLFLFALHRDRGRLVEAEETLERIDAIAPPEHAVRFDLSEGFEQIGQLERAVEILEGVRDVRPEGEVGEDLEMRLAWLYSEVGDEEKALALWRELWLRIDALSRRRYAEDRLMTVASRLGVLADIAIELEERLADGAASERDSSLLVRLYEKVNDAVSAAEVIEEYLDQTGADPVKTLQEQARVYLSCTDYYRYERCVKELIELDPEGEGDYLRQLAMSYLERGKPDLARTVLEELQRLEIGSDSAEFEAGVLALAGMRDEAIVAYRQGIVEHPDRIESYLLLANLMREIGQQGRAIGMFQHLAETADQDDLFTIALDGLLNMEAPAPVLAWARRVTLERIAGREDKTYLYNLVADMAEQENDLDAQRRALEATLAIAGERRPSVLRELMDLSRGTSVGFFGPSNEPDAERHLAYGRRLIGLAEVVPPQVYLDLGEAFLQSDEPSNAAKTFRLARDLPDYDVFVRQAAGLFEQEGYRDEALRWYERVLVARTSDAGLLAKVGELHEQLGRDPLAHDLYRRGVDLLLSRRLLVHTQEEDAASDDPYARWWASRNVDDFDQHYDRLLQGLLVTAHDPATVEAILLDERDAVAADLTAARLAVRDAAEAAGEEPSDELDQLGRHPRVLRRGEYHRRLAFAAGRPDLADELDRVLLAAFPTDEGLLEDLVRERATWGYVASARALIEGDARSEEQRRELLFLVGETGDAGDALQIPIDEARRLVLPTLVEGRLEDARTLLRRVDLGGVEVERVQDIGPLFSAALYTGDLDLGLSLARQWARLLHKHQTSSYQVQSVLDRCAAGLGDERGLSLYQYFVGLVLEDPARAATYVTTFPELQKRYEQPLVDPEQVLAMLEEWDDGGWGFGLGPVLAILPEADRPTALRTIWPSIQKTMRATFLMNLLGELDEPMGDAMGDFVVEVWETAVEDTDEEIGWWFEDLSDNTKNAGVVIRMADVLLDADPEDHAARAVRAVLRKELGEDEAALEDAMHVWTSTRGKTDLEYWDSNARWKIEDAFLEDHADAFLAVLDEAVASGEDPDEVRDQKLQMLSRAGDTEGRRALIEESLAASPDDAGLLGQLRSLQRADGRRVEALATLERMVEADPKNADHWRSLYTEQKSLKDPASALVSYERFLALSEEEGEGLLAGPGFGGPMARTMTIIQPGGQVIRIVNGRVVSGGDDDQPTIGKVKDAVDEGDVETARTTLRRLWRSFPVGEGNANPFGFVSFGGWGVPQWTWPEDEDEEGEDDEVAEAEEEETRYRGGLEAFDEEEPEPAEERQGAYEILAEHDFGLAEIRAMLRTKDARQLDQSQVLFEALLHALLLSGDTDAAREELLANVRSGRASKVDYALLIAFLDEDPERATEDTEEILDDLLRTLSPEDSAGMRRLARVWARQGRTELAVRLYKWVATRTTDTGFFVFGASTSVSAHALVREVKDTLEGADREEVIEAVLRFADPGDYPWQRESFDSLAIDTWSELLGPAEALERCRTICDEAGDLSHGLRRGTAKKAAWLLSRGGELEAAIRCLEVGLCKLDPSELPPDMRWWYSVEYPGNLSHAELRKLFPRDVEDFPDALPWFRAAAAALEGWLDEERVNEGRTIEALAILCRRLAANGGAASAQAIAGRLLTRDDLSPTQLLWLVDAAREAGADALADGTERRLFDEGRLFVERVPEVVARALAEEGPEAALALGEVALAYTAHPLLLDTLAEAAAAVGDDAAAEAHRAARVAYDEAEDALEAAEEEARKKAEEAAEGKG